MKKYKLIRNVTKAECDWLDRDYKEGETVYEYFGCTYGCISGSGRACSVNPDKTPFFELPKDALSLIL